eukprot:TRINITY_DN2190_c0_g3_i1.p1 TRINITY_DN2190_c0_g3~~TRINITY_DN2190_c0_g3_i1.p1  ORF type:complete len:406 (-),score=46.51 TRINITY_DN2190_c0_g3_i1:125-1342(-)
MATEVITRVRVDPRLLIPNKQTIRKTTQRILVSAQSKNDLLKKQVIDWFTLHSQIAWGYLCFFAVISFLLLPLIMAIVTFLLFGFVHGALLVTACCLYNYLEGKVHKCGLVGRRWPLFHRWVGKLMKEFARVLPIKVRKLAKDEEYASPRKFMFGYHPHGVLFYGAGVVAMNWEEYFPGTTCSNLMSSMCFIAPLFRQFCLWTGGIPATRDSAEKAVNNHGSSLSVIPGGLAEMLMSDPRPKKVIIEVSETTMSLRNGAEEGFIINKTYSESIITEAPKREITLFLKNRKGFIKLALQLGLDLVPVFTHGELELYHQMQFALQHRLKLSRFLRLPITFIWGKCFLLPFRRPLTVVVGVPIKVEKTEHPTQEQIDTLHKQYMDALVDIFEKTKAECGYPDTKLLVK